MFEFDWIWLVMAFCGGVFGAAVGALPSFVLCGVGALLGGLYSMSTGSDVNLVDTWVTWGPLVGPQTAFGGGAVAAIYAKRRGVLENGRDICTPLMGCNAPDVLLVGGVFGAIGALLTLACANIPTIGGHASNNAIATAIVLTMMLGRLIFGESGLFGKVAQGTNRWEGSDAGCWLTWQHDWPQILIISCAVGIPASHLALTVPASGLILFGLGCIIFTFMIFGAKVPVFHNIALASLLAVGATQNLWWGLAMAILVAFLCELAAMLFCAHGDSHIDPPTVSLMLTGILQPIFLATGLMKPAGASWDATPVIMVCLFAIGFPILLTALRSIKPKRASVSSELDEAF
ncbi:hypothetical protein HW115_13365 [Verrucomicrobiaceae bacterium N1E253]|uniref:DUF7973 domain-containing protein n=1 Tax=Oceaniferula marina TaxID=2748318 RepID=A0A851GN96_9BACT|nr:hypothetical protein [Oceaniferula marina]NWK56605.1 hypothetical protein [Oceaniferula marina]